MRLQMTRKDAWFAPNLGPIPVMRFMAGAWFWPRLVFVGQMGLSIEGSRALGIGIVYMARQ